MADRKSSFSFRFWSSSPGASSRRAPTTQTTANKPTTTTTTTSTPTTAPTTAPRANSRELITGDANPNPTTESSAIQTTANKPTTTTTTSTPTTAASTTAPRANSHESVTADPNPNPNPTTESAKEHQSADLPKTTTAQTANQPTVTTSTTLSDEPIKTILPSSATTQSPSSSLLKSPSRRAAQSRSPPLPSSPSRGATKAPPSPSRVGSNTSKTLTSTSQKASQRRSPSTSPKVTKPASPSKESKQMTKELKPVASQQEPELKADAKSDSANVAEIGSNHDKVEVAPYKKSEFGTTSTGKLSPSTVDGGYDPLVEPNANPEETKDVKEVQQATKIRANEEKKDVNDFLTPKSGSEAQVIEKAEIPSEPEEIQTGKQEAVDTKEKKDVNNFLTPKSRSEEQVIEKAEIPSKPEEIQTGKQEADDTKEMLAVPLPSAKPTNNKTSQPRKRSTIVGTHKKSSLPVGDHVPFHKDIRDDISTLVNKMAFGDSKSTVQDRPVSVITLAGENRGASMQMGSGSSRKDGPIHIHRGYKINPDESAEAASDAEGSSEEKTSGDGKAIEDQPTEAYVNNNAQGINNSIVFDSSITERNPGVHMVVTHVPKEPIQSIEDKSAPQTRKSEFNMSRSESLTYEPTVRRRCLRGLLLESSDSDPEKPRPHGCRVGCQKRGKENDIDVL